MQIKVTGKQMDVGAALSAHVEEQINGAVEKYFDRAVDAAVTFSRQRHQTRADAKLHLHTGMEASAHGLGGDAHGAFDDCLEKLEKQLRRYKRRLKDHHRDRKNPIEAMAAPAYVIAGDDSGGADEPETLDPVIVAETTMEIRKLSVGEAVMQMELAGASFLMFRNERHDGLSVVFRRDDGNIGWVDPEHIRNAEG